MSTYQVIVSTSQADYLKASIATAALHVTISPFSAGEVGVEFGPLAKTYLEELPTDTDGHLDQDGNLWIGGTDYPVAVLHNT